ncbi:MAG: apolipoprotein N-acyltransferase [Alphaproteobacteria bacterium]|nr:apolipoprotein N-acyltransferase [Alphaproteobacteria bacterium]
MVLAMMGALHRCAGRLSVLRGWRRQWFAAGLGAFATLALPPVYLLPALLVSFPGLVWLLDGVERSRTAFSLGWWFGLGHFVTGIYWIALALLTDPERYGWMIPFAVVGLSAILAVFPGFAAWGVFQSRVKGPGRVVVLALAWTAAEWLRGHIFSGLPWNLIGTVWTISDTMIQLAALTGVWGLSLLTVMCASSPALLADKSESGEVKIDWLHLAPVLIAAAALEVVWAGGAIRLAGAETPTVPDVSLRLVQPNIIQNHKWLPDLREAHLRKHLSLTSSQVKDPFVASAPAATTYVIWPETAAPFFLDFNTTVRFRIAAVTPPGGLVITGMPRATPPDVYPQQVWNSIAAVDSQGVVSGTYDKFHLVPFGEYVPLRSVLPLNKITSGGIDFSAGPGPRTMRLPGLPPFSPLICYEVIFPGNVIDAKDPPQWILNVTNDGWFGLSSGPYQHFASAQLRAVEEGLPLVRAANTGISAVIDSYGRVVASLGLGSEGIIDSPLPQALSGSTVYGRFGDFILLAMLFLGAVAVWYRGKRDRVLRDRNKG